MNRMAVQAAVTMKQLQNKLDVVSHNMANLETTGYKSRNAQFTSLLTQQINNFSDEEANALGRITPNGIRLGSGAKLGQVNMNLSLGTVKQTGRGLDLALLEDNHLLQVDVTNNGVTERRFTRDGTLYLNEMGNGQVMLSNGQGHPIVGQNGPIILDTGMEDVSISSNGSIQVTRNGQTTVEGQLSIVQAIRPQFLEAAGNNQFRLPDVTAAAYNAGDIIQDVAFGDVALQTGALESSNVNMATQMTEMMETQRAYQFNARTISMHDQMRGLVNQLR
ncbi:flagellar hook-basal body protein [Paraliobacillus salinarum]|uniref:flagellar hook-basal body protein n=1 Tax=Paraliobacillus salinarum TaxID=1158996 RepID=UPI0015F41538|nr:flagellar hook-basal body protein [Paraliobacillus salinarum]